MLPEIVTSTASISGFIFAIWAIRKLYPDLGKRYWQRAIQTLVATFLLLAVLALFTFPFYLLVSFVIILGGRGLTKYMFAKDKYGAYILGGNYMDTHSNFSSKYKQLKPLLCNVKPRKQSPYSVLT